MVPSLVPKTDIFVRTCTSDDSTNQDVHSMHQYKNTNQNMLQMAELIHSGRYTQIYTNLILNWWKFLLGKGQTRTLHESECRWCWRISHDINYHKVRPDEILASLSESISFVLHDMLPDLPDEVHTDRPDLSGLRQIFLAYSCIPISKPDLTLAKLYAALYPLIE